MSSGDGEQVVVLTERRGDLGGVAGGGDDAVAGVQGRLGQVDAQTASGAGDEPDGGSVVGHWQGCLS